MTQTFQPYQAGERFHLPDLLRGVALFGILVVNMAMFSAPLSYYIDSSSHWLGTGNFISHAFIRFFFEGKFYSLFSILFGMGFYLFYKKAEAQAIINRLYLRRLFVLLLFGIAHVYFLWYGDILIFYACIALFLFAFKSCKNKTLIIWIVVLLAIPILFTGFSALMIKLAQMSPTGAEIMDKNIQAQIEVFKNLGDKALVVYSSGSFSEIASVRWAEYKVTLTALIVMGPNILAMFLSGLLLARKGYLTVNAKTTSFFKKALIWGLLIGIPANFLFTWKAMTASSFMPSTDSILSTLGSNIGGASFAIAMIGFWGLIYQKGWLKKLTVFLANTGRMALSVYLLESIICTSLFYSYGFGLYGKVSLYEGILLAFVIYVALAFLSQYLAKKLHFGPAEWLWRSLTYLKIQPFIKRP